MEIEVLIYKSSTNDEVFYYVYCSINNVLIVARFYGRKYVKQSEKQTSLDCHTDCNRKEPAPCPTPQHQVNQEVTCRQ